MLVSDIKTLKRFSICYMKQIGEELKKHFEIIPAKTESDALNKLLTRKQVPIQKIHRDSNKEGYLYCNEVYNPIVEEEGIMEDEL